MTGAAVSNAPACPCSPIAERVAAFDWQRLAADLDAHGCAAVGAVLSPDSLGSTRSQTRGPPPGVWCHGHSASRAGHGVGDIDANLHTVPQPR